MEILRKYVPLLLFIVSVVWALRVLLLPNYPDFQVHYYGAQHLVQRENPYLPDTNYFTPQVYPPFDMVFFIPLSFFPYDIAAKVWIVLSIAAIFLSILLINRIYKESFFSPLNLFLSSLVFIAFPTKFTLGMGQINAVILLFAVLIWYYINKKEYIKTGIAFAFPVMLKFFPLLLGPYLVINKKWKVLISAAIAVLVLLLVSLTFVSIETHVYFFQTLLPDLLRSWKGDYYNQSFTGLLMRSTADESVRQSLRVIVPLCFLVITFGVIFIKRSENIVRINLEISILIIISLLINNFSWQHHFILLVLPFFIIVYSLKELKYKWLYVFVALSYSLIAINFVDPKAVPALVQSHVFFGGLLLWTINLYMLLKYKK
jgi:hypothetical protein